MRTLTGFGFFDVVTTVDAVTFGVAAAIILIGALGVVLARNTVHSALMLVMTLFGVAVLFVELQANFLAAVQVIVYAGAIVVLFLFVIMFLGVDKDEERSGKVLVSQWWLGLPLVVLALVALGFLGWESKVAVGAASVVAPRSQPGGDVAALGRAVFTTYLFPFEATAALLLIAVVGAVVLARRALRGDSGAPEPAEPALGPSDDEPGDLGAQGGGERLGSGPADDEDTEGPDRGAPEPVPALGSRSAVGEVAP